MSTDPYFEVAGEIQSSLQAAETLLASYARIRSTARSDSEELIYARNELKATLTTLEADLDDLDESVRVVEETGARLFGLSEAEVIERRKYVQRVRKEVENMRVEISSSESQSSSSSRRNSAIPQRGQYSKVDGVDGEDDQAEWSKAEQAMMIQQQDRTLSTISGTLTTLATQAGLIGQEVSEHNELLDDLEANIDRSDTKLSGAMNRMRKFIRETEETKSGWCIAILIVILLVLLLAVILV